MILLMKERESHKLEEIDGKRQAAAGVKKKKEDEYQAKRRRAKR